MVSTRVGNGGIFPITNVNCEELPSGCVWKSAGERRDIVSQKTLNLINERRLYQLQAGPGIIWMFQ